MSDNKPTCKTYPNGDKQWWLNGKLHREDGPAVECANGTKEWWLNNEITTALEVFKQANDEQRKHMLAFIQMSFPLDSGAGL